MAQIGLKDLYFAKITQDDETGVAYDTPVKIAPAVSSTVTPNASSATLYGDDIPLNSADTMSGIEVTINTTDLPLDKQALLLGATVNANGELINKASDKAPDGALLFKSLKDDGTYRFVKLLKGHFRASEETYNTKGESVEYSTPSLTGTFVPRKYDEQWKRTADEGKNGFSGGPTWFSSVE